MPILNNITQITLKPFPKAIQPKTHAALDYANIGLFLLAAGAFWRRSKRAAVGALISGGTGLAVNLLTDYPGGVKKVITYRRHRDIDLGIAALTAIMPEFLVFKDERERRFFLVEGVLISAITELTKFPSQQRRSERSSARAA